MIHLKAACLVLMVLVAAPTYASAQSGGRYLDIRATPPFQPASEREGSRKFRVAFRVYGISDENVSIVTVRQEVTMSTIGVLGWRAMSLAGKNCYVDDDDIKGVVAYGRFAYSKINLEYLAEEASSDYKASATRPLLVSADFTCDAPLESRESFDIQAKFFVRVGIR